MLHIYTSSKELCFHKLMDLYFSEFQDAGPILYDAEQDFYSYLLDFLKQDRSFYAVWEQDGKYLSALRMEPYQDGLLMEGLVTDIPHRKKGHAKALILKTLEYAASIGIKKVYSHIKKSNIASISTHIACGFSLLCDYAVYIDGSVDHHSSTYFYKCDNNK